MAKNTKTWISWERNIIFRRNKAILNLCFRWHILRIYRFVAEVTFNITLPSLIVQLIIAKAGISFSVLHVFMDLISAWVLIYSVFIRFLCGEYMFWWMYDGPLGFKFLFLPYNLQAIWQVRRFIMPYFVVRILFYLKCDLVVESMVYR